MPDEYEVDDYSSEVSMKFRDVSVANCTTAAASQRDDPGRRQELEALSAAMMTVDNGFEDQWWYQGERQQTTAVVRGMHTSATYASTTATAEAVPETPVQQLGNDVESMGWTTVQDDAHANTMSATIYNPSVLVSPMTEYASPRLHRSLTTRSDELFLY